MKEKLERETNAPEIDQGARPKKKGGGGQVSTATEAPDDGMPSAVTGEMLTGETGEGASSE